MVKNKITYILIAILFLLSNNTLYSQLIERIKNPYVTEGLNKFMGGSEGDLFFSFFGEDKYTYHFDGNKYTDITGAMSAWEGSHFVGKDALKSYIAVSPSHINNAVVLNRHDNDSNYIERVLPVEGYLNVWYQTSYLNYPLLRESDLFLENIIFVYQVNGIDYIITNPENLLPEDHLAVFKDELLLIYKDSMNRNHLYSFDNTMALENIELPLDTESFSLQFKSEDFLYFSIRNSSNTSTLYTFDGDAFVELSPSPNMEFVKHHGANAVSNEYFLSYRNENDEIDSYVYSVDEMSFSKITIPADLSIDRVSNIWDEATYVVLKDNLSSSEFLYWYMDGDLQPVSLPLGYEFNSFLVNYNNPYFNIQDQNASASLAMLDVATNTMQIVPLPASTIMFLNYHAVFEDKMLVSYSQENSIKLFMYDGVLFKEVMPELASLEAINFLKVIIEDNGILYLTFSEIESMYFSSRVLYKLITTNGIPESEDQELDAPINAPYFFSNEDFYFNDTDIGDTLHSIIITEIGPFGEFLLNGDPIQEGDTILSGIIASMVFNPPNNESGTFEFRFKVGDGRNYSITENVITINIEIQNNLPYSADTSITIFVNEPYTFDNSLFAFFDDDAMDTLHSIWITDVVQSGSLLLNGSEVMPNDTILSENISSLMYLSPQDEESIASFSYRIGVGKDYSEAINQVTIHVINDPTISVSDLAAEAEIKIYPMPTSGTFTLDIEARIPIENLKLRLINSNQQIILEESFSGLKRRFKKEINMNDFLSGNYFLMGISTHGRFARTIVVIRD
ncbi:MAG: hypothetical protein AAGA77_01585 [Bacteroidota bacterium]